MKFLRNKIQNLSFSKRHSLPRTFIRRRKLPFRFVLLLLLQKSIKSIQLVLNEFFMVLQKIPQPATNSAYCQARCNFLHSAFIELTEDIVAHFYDDTDYVTYKGHRLLSVDGSKVILPQEAEVGAHFGWTTFHKHPTDASDVYTYGLASVCYDVLNHLTLDSILASSKSSERELLLEHLDSVRAGDILVFDRGYASYLLLATLRKKGIHFIGRCQRNTFKESRELFTRNILSKTVGISFPPKKRRPNELADLPESVKVRFVRLVLQTGEVEVLVTSLLDEDEYPQEDFYELYNQRWCIETFYGTLKERLHLEHFTGKSVATVLQDFYSTIFVTNLETLLTYSSQKELTQRRQNNIHTQKINKAVSFNALKNNVIELLLSSENEQVIVTKLRQLFMKNPIYVRCGRSSPRVKPQLRQQVHYLKRRRKEIY